MTDIVKPKRARRFARMPDVDPPLGREPSSPLGKHTTSGLPAEPAGKPESKAARIVALMQRAEGATLEEMVAATDWLPHTTRAAMTGLKRKGHTITSIKADGVRRYFAVAPQ